MELIARHMRERFGLRVVLLSRVATKFDADANRGRKADFGAVALIGVLTPGRELDPESDPSCRRTRLEQR